VNSRLPDASADLIALGKLAQLALDVDLVRANPDAQRAGEQLLGLRRLWIDLEAARGAIRLQRAGDGSGILGLKISLSVFQFTEEGRFTPRAL
jgi:hypothetical protein